MYLSTDFDPGKGGLLQDQALRKDPLDTDNPNDEYFVRGAAPPIGRDQVRARVMLKF